MRARLRSIRDAQLEPTCRIEGREQGLAAVIDDVERIRVSAARIDVLDQMGGVPARRVAAVSARAPPGQPGPSQFGARAPHGVNTISSVPCVPSSAARKIYDPIAVS